MRYIGRYPNQERATENEPSPHLNHYILMILCRINGWALQEPALWTTMCILFQNFQWLPNGQEDPGHFLLVSQSFQLGRHWGLCMNSVLMTPAACGIHHTGPILVLLR